jgi:hypothetical protein
MATYTVTFTIDDEAPGLSNSNQYPLLMAQTNHTFGSYDTGSTDTKMTDNTLYFKQGDTIRVKHIHPSGLAINYAGSDTAPAGSAHPDPTPEGNQVSGYEWRTLTWSGNFTDDSNNVTDSADDYETFWYFWGPDSAGTNAYSQKLRFNKVSGTLAASGASVVQGGTLTFNVNNLVGLLSSVGATWDNRLWINIKNSSGYIQTNMSWSQGSSYVGSLNSGSSTTVLTIPSNMATGTYTANLCHYNAGILADEWDASTNRFFSTDNQMGTLSFTVTSTANPNPNAFSFTNQTNLALSTEYESDVVELGGMETASTVTAISGGASYRINQTGSWYTGTGTVIPANADIELKNTSSGSTSTAVTSTITIGSTQSSDWTLTTGADSDDDPNAFSFLNQTNLALSTTYASDVVTLTGMNAASTVTAISGGASYRINETGSWYTGTGTAVPSNADIELKNTSSGSYSTPVTSTITVGTTQSSAWTLTTGEDPATIHYGLQVMNGNGTNEIFGYNVSTSHIIAEGSIDVPYLTNNNTVTISNIEGMTAGNTNTIGVALFSPVPYLGRYLTHTRGTGQFTITNSIYADSSLTVTIKARYMVFRY